MVRTSWKTLSSAALVAALSLQGCATIPKEAPELSTQLGNRIAAIQTSHLHLLHKYFDERRSQVDDFIMKEWVPAFASEVFSEPSMEKVWLEIVRSDDKKDRLEFVVRLGPKLQAKINSERQELIKPLDDAERLIERTLSGEYDQAKAINNTLTSFLVSASRVDENRRRYLELVGVTDHKVADVIDKVDSSVSTLLDATKTVVDKEAKARDYLDQLKAALSKLQK
jgi:hypothetical protein